MEMADAGCRPRPRPRMPDPAFPEPDHAPRTNEKVGIASKLNCPQKVITATCCAASVARTNLPRARSQPSKHMWHRRSQRKVRPALPPPSPPLRFLKALQRHLVGTEERPTLSGTRKERRCERAAARAVAARLVPTHAAPARRLECVQNRRDRNLVEDLAQVAAGEAVDEGEIEEAATRILARRNQLAPTDCQPRERKLRVPRQPQQIGPAIAAPANAQRLGSVEACKVCPIPPPPRPTLTGSIVVCVWRAYAVWQRRGAHASWLDRPPSHPQPILEGRTVALSLCRFRICEG